MADERKREKGEREKERKREREKDGEEARQHEGGGAKNVGLRGLSKEQETVILNLQIDLQLFF